MKVDKKMGRGEGGANVARLGEILDDIALDLKNIHAKIAVLTAKLDADATVTDTNYAELSDPPALHTTTDSVEPEEV